MTATTDQTTEKRLELAMSLLEETLARLREANDRLERTFGIEPPKPKLELVQRETTEDA